MWFRLGLRFETHLGLNSEERGKIQGAPAPPKWGQGIKVGSAACSTTDIQCYLFCVTCFCRLRVYIRGLQFCGSQWQVCSAPMASTLLPAPAELHIQSFPDGEIQMLVSATDDEGHVIHQRKWCAAL